MTDRVTQYDAELVRELMVALEPIIWCKGTGTTKEIELEIEKIREIKNRLIKKVFNKKSNWRLKKWERRGKWFYKVEWKEKGEHQFA